MATLRGLVVSDVFSRSYDSPHINPIRRFAKSTWRAACNHGRCARPPRDFVSEFSDSPFFASRCLTAICLGPSRVDIYEPAPVGNRCSSNHRGPADHQTAAVVVRAEPVVGAGQRPHSPRARRGGRRDRLHPGPGLPAPPEEPADPAPIRRRSQESQVFPRVYGKSP